VELDRAEVEDVDDRGTIGLVATVSAALSVSAIKTRTRQGRRPSPSADMRSSSSKGQRLQVSGLDKGVDIPFGRRCNSGVGGGHDLDLDVPQLSGLSEIGGTDDRLGAVDDAFWVQAGTPRIGIN
jgi:hypothetical protein